MKEGWAKGTYQINTGEGREEVAGYVRGCFGIRKHFTRFIYQGGETYKRLGPEKPKWEVTHIPTGALLGLDLPTLTLSQRFCDRMLEIRPWRFKSRSGAMARAFEREGGHVERTLKGRRSPELVLDVTHRKPRRPA